MESKLAMAPLRSVESHKLLWAYLYSAYVSFMSGSVLCGLYNHSISYSYLDDKYTILYLQISKTFLDGLQLYVQTSHGEWFWNIGGKNYH